MNVKCLILILVLSACNAPQPYGEVQSGSRVAKRLIGKALKQESLHSALYHAASGGHADLVKILLAHGPSVSSKDALDQSEHGYTDQMDDVNKVDENGNTPLHLAKDVDEVARLVAKGADVNRRNNDGQTPLHITTDPEVAGALIFYKADVNAQDNYGTTPLYEAVDRNDKLLTIGLLTNRADPNLTGKHTLAPLAIAQSVDIAKLLINYGANLNHNPSGSLILIYVKSGEVAEEILKSGGDPNARGKDGTTALHYPNINDDVAEVLISRGADINAQDNEGKTPLHYAAKRGYADGFKFFLYNGADSRTKDKAGKTPLDYADDRNDEDIIRIFWEYVWQQQYEQYKRRQENEQHYQQNNREHDNQQQRNGSNAGRNYQGDAFAVLGVSKDASSKKIKQAYHDIALKYHPDKNNSPEAEEIFKEANNAYQHLQWLGKVK